MAVWWALCEEVWCIMASVTPGLPVLVIANRKADLLKATG